MIITSSRYYPQFSSHDKILDIGLAVQSCTYKLDVSIKYLSKKQNKM